MNQDKSQQTRQLILDWSHQILKGMTSSYYYSLFMARIERIYGLRICFDESISQLILQLLNSVKFQSFSEQQRLLQRQTLFQIANTLYVEDYIGKRQYLYLMNQKKLFLNICEEGQPNIAEIEQLWITIMDIPFEQFWRNCKKMKKLPNILENVYDKVKGMKGTEDFITFYKKESYKQVKQSKNSIKELSSIQKKQKRYRLVEDIRIIDKKQVSTQQQQESSPKRNPINLNEDIKQITFDYLTQNTQKYERFQSYIKQVKSNGSKISYYLLKIVYKQALFFNKQYALIVSSIHTFINILIKKLKSSKILCFQLFGSIRNSLALMEQFDIDISSIPKVKIDTKDHQQKKKQQADLLFYLRNKLKDNQYPWLSSRFVNNFKNLKVPFLKLTLNSEEMESQFGFSVSKVDITIGNQSGAKNSQLIGKFMFDPSIAAFCLLIKLWAKRTGIINTAYPMKGLSSYGIALMSLYYLMESKQINFIQLDIGFNVVTDVIQPNLNNCKLKSLQDNFYEFLQFYRQTGRFQKQQQTICLLKNFQTYCNFQFNHEILFNMCDFIDKTNPGRFRFDEKKIIYSRFQTSIRAIKQGLEIIKDLFGDKS